MTKEEFKAATGQPLGSFARDCHAASVALMRSGVLGECRVARGTCEGVGGQHSWVVLGNDCYDRNAEVVDATLWSYDKRVKGVWHGLAYERPHEPFGHGSLWEYGKPTHMGGETITLDAELSSAAELLLDMIGPLDYKGWSQLAHAPVGARDWPAEEIIGAMYDHPKLSVLIPIDIVGMITDRNPAGMYLPIKERA